jgi:hypothetical protein
MKGQTKNIIIIVIVAAVLMLAYFLFFKSSPAEPDLTTSAGGSALPAGSTSDQGSAAGSEFLSMLLNVKSIQLNDSIFNDPAFASLHDSSITLTPDAVIGRPNPFAPIGTDLPPTPTPTSTTTTTTAPIDMAAITGITAPVTGAVPTSTISSTTEYTATISWSPTDNPFLANTAYTATITVTPTGNYTLTGVPSDFFTVDGATTTNDAGSGVVTAVFPATGSGSSNNSSGNSTDSSGN